jgi:hypothetical protein
VEVAMKGFVKLSTEDLKRIQAGKNDKDKKDKDNAPTPKYGIVLRYGVIPLYGVKIPTE